MGLGPREPKDCFEPGKYGWRWDTQVVSIQAADVQVIQQKHRFLLADRSSLRARHLGHYSEQNRECQLQLWRAPIALPHSKVLHRGSRFDCFNADGGDPLEQHSCAVLEAMGRRSALRMIAPRSVFYLC